MTSLAAATPTPRDFLRLMMGPAAYAMLALIVVQEIFGAATTWLVIQIARDIAEETVSLGHFGWIVVAQTASYLAGAVGWMFAERAGFGAYAKYVLRFARLNRHQTTLLTDAEMREKTEPFLTGEAFQICFSLIYDLQFHLRLLFHLIFNALVFGIEIDIALPFAYALALAVLVVIQWALRKPLATAYLRNQQMTNRMTARTYNAWDNVLAGNRYNFSIWQKDFRTRWQDALSAQVRAILMREGWSAASGVIALLIVLAATILVAMEDMGDTALLIGLAATLPRQIEMTLDMHQLTAGMTDLIAIWSRISGLCDYLRLSPAEGFADRVCFGEIVLFRDGHEQTCTSLADASRLALEGNTGRIAVRGPNGVGKSSLLVALKAALRDNAYYWPSHDRLSYRFNTRTSVVEEIPADEDEVDEAEDLNASEMAEEKAGFSSGERQLQVLRELVAATDYPVYLLDEWDANLDEHNRAEAEALILALAGRARVIEISHRDRRARGEPGIP